MGGSGEFDWICHFVFDSIDQYELETDNFLTRFAELIADYRSYESKMIKASPYSIFDERGLNEQKERVFKILNSIKKHTNLNDTRIMRFPLEILEGIFHVTQTHTYLLNIESCKDWLTLMDSCYSLGCINCEDEGWMAIDGQKQPFRQWMTGHSVVHDPSYFRYDEQYFSDRTFCTAFDTKKQKRLIIDGLHRANALTLACDGGCINIPTITIVECSGDKLEVLFPCDIHHLPS